MNIFKKLFGRLSAAEQAAALAESSRRAALDAAMLRSSCSLEALTCCVMLVDDDRQIVSLNAAAVRMLRSAEADIRKQVHGFTVDMLKGSRLDLLFDGATQSLALPDAPGGTASAELKLGARTFVLDASPVHDPQQRKLGTVIEWRDVSEKRQLEKSERERNALASTVAAENAGILAALDRITSNVLLVDANNVIVYANDAMVHMLTAAEQDICLLVPGFNPRELRGKVIESFAQNAAADLQQFKSLARSSNAQLAIGPRTFSMTANPVIGGRGERIGTVIEWRDLTEELRFKAVIQSTIGAAVEGNLQLRIDAENQSGFLGGISGGINQVLASFESVMTEASLVMSGLATGNLTRKISGDYKGSFNRLKGDINGTIDKLVDVVLEIRDSAANVKSGASEIATGNTNLSHRTEEQAASLEETSSAMEEITTTVQQNAANALQANSLARGARESAENGGKVVGQAIAAMQAISESSTRINDIIGVIDEIAFQTNLLALNAAVEAARAGDQGRGFAVVADEVRSLAGRSAKAAKEIKELIKISSNRVREGSSLVNKSGETLEEIVTAVKRVNDIVAEISTASDEQATGLHEINRAVGEMDAMTQQNAALVEEAAAASESLGTQSESLEKLIRFFDTGKHAARPAASYANGAVRTAAQQQPKPHAQYLAASAGRQIDRQGTAQVARRASAATAGRTAQRGSVVKHPYGAKNVTAIRKPVASQAARVLDDDENNWTEF